jgi:hypothetical protein
MQQGQPQADLWVLAVAKTDGVLGRLWQQMMASFAKKIDKLC